MQVHSRGIRFVGTLEEFRREIEAMNKANPGATLLELCRKPESPMTDREEGEAVVASAKIAQAKSLKGLDEDIQILMDALPDRIKCMRSVDLATELDRLAGLIRARHYIRTNMGE